MLDAKFLHFEGVVLSDASSDMTRFARARGSKAENARVPEEATSWAKMRADMRAASAARGAGNPEEEDDGEGGAVAAVAAAGDDGLDSEGEPMEVATADSDSEESEDGQEEDEDSKIKTEAPAQGVTQLADGPEVAGEVKKKKKRKRREDKCLQCKERGHRKMDCPTLTEERRKELRELLVLKRERKGKGTGRKKNKNKGAGAAGGAEKVQAGRVEKRKEAADGKKAGKKKKLKKDKAGQLVQDGEGLFQGFRVKKEDEARLRKLETALKSKGLAGAELSAELKKERRRAEKDLARFHKDVCYGCRQPGHQLAACPQAKRQVLDKDVLHSGQCYKCGSDDHTSKECKSSKRKGADAFAFAVCFICK